MYKIKVTALGFVGFKLGIHVAIVRFGLRT